MRASWDERARLNAVWFFDTSLRYDDPDMKQFFATGRVIVDEALADLPGEMPSRSLAVEIVCGLGRACALCSPSASTAL